ncbi:MAG: T9SS type A sorting domain-containing protein [Bacteroidetes bacterium]|nr:T9SS type A sorting domain-containing protein [Bacteroidota bacterium]MCB0843918.1 T9SS type A sorting domain-containing protein [Bacteroidota bacterium]
MINKSSTLIFLALIGLFSGGVFAQNVFTKVYYNQIKAKNMEWAGHNLIVAGDHYTPVASNHSNFAFWRMDTTGSISHAVSYHNTSRDFASFVREHPDGGFVIGGFSQYSSQNPDSSELVIIRTFPNGAVKWARAYYKGNHKAGYLTGLEVNGDGTIVFTAQMYGHLTNNTPNIHGAVIQVDTAGVPMWHRVIRLGNNALAPNPLATDGIPSANLAIQNNGTIVTGWNFFYADTANNVVHRGVSFQAYDPTTGNLVWDKQYRAKPLISMALTPQDNGIAAYLVNPQGNRALLKLDANGDQEWANLDAWQGPITRAVSLKPVNNFIPYLANNRLIIERDSPNFVIRPAIESNAQQVRLADFVTKGRRAYIIGHTIPNSNLGFRPILTKTKIDSVGNCFMQFNPSNNFASLTLDTLNVNLSSSVQVVLHVDTLNLLTGLLSHNDTTVCVGSGLVWPGDANSDGVANVVDFLFVGLGWGNQGPPRTNPTTAWVGQPATDWIGSFFNGVNRKHADANGNGHIGFGDIIPIFLNYGLTHNKGDQNGSPEDPPLALAMPVDSILAGETVEVSVMFGDADHPLSDIHGLSFYIKYDPALIDTNSMKFVPASSWFGTDSVDMIYMENDIYTEGLLEVGLTRITQTDAAGYGMIGKLTFVTIDNISGKNLVAEKLKLDIRSKGAMNAQEDWISVYGLGDSIVVYQIESTGIKDNLIGENVVVYPNPVNDLLKIESDAIVTEWIEMTNLMGKVVLRQEIGRMSEEVNISGLSSGVYFLTGKTKEGYYTRKIIKN